MRKRACLLPILGLLLLIAMPGQTNAAAADVYTLQFDLTVHGTPVFRKSSSMTEELQLFASGTRPLVANHQTVFPLCGVPLPCKSGTTYHWTLIKFR